MRLRHIVMTIEDRQHFLQIFLEHLDIAQLVYLILLH